MNDAGKGERREAYRVATGPAEWRNLDGDIGALVPGGCLLETTIYFYICRKQIELFRRSERISPRISRQRQVSHSLWR